MRALNSTFSRVLEIVTDKFTTADVPVFASITARSRFHVAVAEAKGISKRMKETARKTKSIPEGEPRRRRTRM